MDVDLRESVHFAKRRDRIKLIDDRIHSVHCPVVAIPEALEVFEVRFVRFPVLLCQIVTYIVSLLVAYIVRPGWETVGMSEQGAEKEDQHS